MGHVYIIGMGPGGRDYLTRAAEKAIAKADMLVGHTMQVASYAKAKKRIVPVEHNYAVVCEAIVSYMKKHTVAVLVSGDPGLFSFAKQVREQLPSGAYTIIPGISSVQLACARFGLSWDDAEIVSLHGKTKRGLVAVVRSRTTVGILTDPKNTPNAVARYLFRNGIRKRQVYLAENLGRTDERLTETTVCELKDMIKEWKRLCVMMVVR